MIQKSRALRVLIWLFLAGQILFFALAWSPGTLMVSGLSMQMAPSGMGFQEARGLSAVPRLWGILVASPALWALAFGVWRLDRLLGVKDHRAMFSVRSIGHLRAFAGATAVSTLWSIVEVPARGLVFRHWGGIAQDAIKIGVSSEALLLLLVCVAFYLVTNLMHEARRIAQENEGFV